MRRQLHPLQHRFKHRIRRWVLLIHIQPRELFVPFHQLSLLYILTNRLKDPFRMIRSLSINLFGYISQLGNLVKKTILYHLVYPLVQSRPKRFKGFIHPEYDCSESTISTHLYLLLTLLFSLGLACSPRCPFPTTSLSLDGLYVRPSNAIFPLLSDPQRPRGDVETRADHPFPLWDDLDQRPSQAK
jgi:hypothetical protein